MYLCLFFCLIASTSLLQLPVVIHVDLNPVVWCLVMIGMLRGAKVGLIVGIMIGLVQDITFGTFLGETAFAYAIIGYLTGYARSFVVRDSMALAVLLTGISALLFSWVTYATSRFFGEATILLHAAVIESARGALSTMVLCLLLYVPFYRAFARKPLVRYDDESVEV